MKRTTKALKTMKVKAAVAETEPVSLGFIEFIAPKVIENTTASATTEGALCTPWKT